MRRSAWLLLLIAAACQNPLTVRPDQEFTLALGERVQVQDAGFELTFTSVPLDTRCPINVVCIAAGNAQVLLAVHFGPPQAFTPDLPLILNTTSDPRASRVGGYLVELLTLDPQPIAGQPPPKKYQATLRVGILGAIP